MAASVHSYYTLPSIKSDIDALSPKCSEAQVGNIWLTTLMYSFPVTSNYTYSLDGSVLLTQQSVTVKRPDGRSSGRQNKFLAVKCAAAAYDTTKAASELEAYLRRIHKDTAVPYKVYGAVAIGRKVRFYEYDSRKQKIVGLKGHEKAYDLASECEVVQRVLDGMKVHRA